MADKKTNKYIILTLGQIFPILFAFGNLENNQPYIGICHDTATSKTNKPLIENQPTPIFDLSYTTSEGCRGAAVPP